MIAAVRLALRISAGKCTSTAAVAIVVRGQSEFTAMASCLSSSAMPSVHMLMPYLLIVYATWPANHFAFIESGGDRLRMCALAAFFRCGMHACEQRNVARMLTATIRSKRFAGVA